MSASLHSPLARLGLALSLAAGVAGGATACVSSRPAPPGRHYAGYTTQAKFNGFRGRVTFVVSSDWSQVQAFTYQSFGCLSTGGPLQPHLNYLSKPYSVHLLGTIRLHRGGRFAASGVRTSYTSGRQTTVTTSSVSGQLVRPGRASGTIVFTQRTSGGIVMSRPCGPLRLGFGVRWI